MNISVEYNDETKVAKVTYGDGGSFEMAGANWTIEKEVAYSEENRGDGMPCMVIRTDTGRRALRIGNFDLAAE